MRDHLSTCGVCHIRLVVPIRLGGAFAGLVPGGDVCVDCANLLEAAFQVGNVKRPRLTC